MFCSMSVHGLKPICPWLFASSSALSNHLLSFAWSSLPLRHRQRLIGRWPLVLSWIALALPQRFSILVTLWNDSSANSAVKSDFKLLYITLNSHIKSGFSTGRNLRYQIWSPQILWCSLISCDWLARSLAHDERWFYLSSVEHASCDEWNNSFSAKSAYCPRMPPIYCRYWSVGPAFHLSAFPMVS